MKHRAVWHDKDGKLQMGILTSVKAFAITEVLFKRSLGLTAWLQDDEDNKVEF